MTACWSRCRSLRDARLEQALLVLRRVVLEVLREVAEGARRRDRLDRGLALRAFHVGELGLERLALGGGELLSFEIAHPHSLTQRRGGSLSTGPP